MNVEEYSPVYVIGLEKENADLRAKLETAEKRNTELEKVIKDTGNMWRKECTKFRKERDEARRQTRKTETACYIMLQEQQAQVDMLRGALETIYNITAKDMGLSQHDTTKAYVIARDSLAKYRGERSDK